ncbi:hypothetical protein OS493_027816 [Desmophyllum pertusum]|uniref:CUB domain-containing protein n=1 Tax=Desmophyllum pertusum TaxID=174260 RepID=A0A9X0CR30_9CNID|nr:hypothetical protein OS493_027816 [Desmophyllum pertusum]
MAVVIRLMIVHDTLQAPQVQSPVQVTQSTTLLTRTAHGLSQLPADKKLRSCSHSFDVKRGSVPQSCKEDFVEARNGLTDLSRKIGGRYCNGNRSMLITTDRNIVRIHFHSGSTSASHKGFQIDYLSVTPGLNDVLAVKACDEDVIALDCSSFDYTINILHAVYGSFPYSCGQQSTTTTCPALDTKIAQMAPQNVNWKFSISVQVTSIKTPAPTTPSPPPTPAQRSTVAPSTVQTPTTTNNQHSNSFTGNTTGSPTLIPTTEPFKNTNTDTNPTTTPSQIVVFSVGTESNPGGSSKSAAPPIGGKEARTGSGLTTGTMAGVVVAIIVTLVLAMIVAFFVRRKRHQKDKGKRLPSVTFTPEREYSMPDNCQRRRCPLDAGNAYETVNILYQSADNNSESNTCGKEDNNAYDSCSVPNSLPKVTENPLYTGVSPPFNNSVDEGYELVKPTSTVTVPVHYER